MAVEKYIRGKSDSGKHEGKRSEVRRIRESVEFTRDELFFDLYGHPYGWCEWLAKLDGQLGQTHREHLKCFGELIRGIPLQKEV